MARAAHKTADPPQGNAALEKSTPRVYSITLSGRAEFCAPSKVLVLKVSSLKRIGHVLYATFKCYRSEMVFGVPGPSGWAYFPPKTYPGL